MDWASTLNVTVKVDVISCAACGVPFGVPRDLLEKLQASGETFYCPTGHHNVYRETEADRLRRQLQDKEAALARARQARDSYRDRLDGEERSHAATKGHLTRARRRHQAGVCPVPECRRSFGKDDRLARHLETVHPDWTPTGGGEVKVDGPYGSMRKRPSRGQGPATYDCACGGHFTTAARVAARHARTCAHARQPWPDGSA